MAQIITVIEIPSDKTERSRAQIIGVRIANSRGVYRCSDDVTWENGFSRHINTGIEIGYRSRRGNACPEMPTRIRQEEGCGTYSVRVQRVEILEMGNRGGIDRGGEQDQFVYDIEVEGNHNYFANGILVHNCMIRRLKRDVIEELPPKTRVIIELDNDGLEWQLEWNAMLAKIKRTQEVKDFKPTGDEFADTAALLEDDLQLAFNEMSEFRHKAALAKLEPFIEDVHERMEELEKVVIFGHHRDCMSQLMTAFARYSPVQIVGDTKDPMRAQWEFQNLPECRMILGSDSMMEGFTLTAASVALFFEPDWVPGKLDQKESRLHRIGQRDNVLCYYYVLRNSLDARMIKRALAKQEIIDAALDKK